MSVNWQLVYGFGWMTALHGVRIVMVSSYNGCMQRQQQQSVWSCRPLRMLPCIHVDLVAYSWSISCSFWLLKYGCVAWPAYKPTPKALLSKFSQKLSAYTRVYTVILQQALYWEIQAFRRATGRPRTNWRNTGTVKKDLQRWGLNREEWCQLHLGALM